jgi:hypothetical protein
MFRRALIAIALSCSTLLLAGCGTRTGPAEDTPPVKAPTAGPMEAPPVDKVAAPKPAGPGTVTLHVKGMTERLKLV